MPKPKNPGKTGVFAFLVTPVAPGNPRPRVSTGVRRSRDGVRGGTPPAAVAERRAGARKSSNFPARRAGLPARSLASRLPPGRVRGGRLLGGGRFGGAAVDREPRRLTPGRGARRAGA